MKEIKKLRELTAFQYWLGSNYNTLPTDSAEMTKRANLYNKTIDSGMKLTKKFIKENAEMTLKEAFPEVFETFTGWMVSESNGWLGYFENNILKYGLVYDKWFLSSKITLLKNVNCDRPATPQEIQDVLEKEAVRRGFKEGVNINRPFDKYLNNCSIDKNIFPKDVDFFYNFKNDYLEHFGFVIYSKGTWATIITTITKQEAEERLGMKII